ncbi:MAG: redox-sensing transcriptional repressor Rex [Verrucomicrobiota bacterium]|nr:redox-sensing transcriptional repressor Rex [Verrucomicrobiota bacterium]
MKKVARTEIPRKAIYRLSVYSRCLRRLENNGIHTVSSEVLAKAAGVKSTQLRKDLTYFGQFGTRGLGYDVRQLSEMILELLGTKSLQPVVIVGVGNLGRALLSYRGFEREGFEIVGAFDSRPGQYLSGDMSMKVQAMDKLPKVIDKHVVKMAILCVPPNSAQEVANKLIKLGVVALLNFAPIVLSVPDEITVNNVNLAMELENLSYFINE